MAGRIVADDIAEVKRRTNLADLIGDYVALKSAGVDSMKGLCPFHDERSPSFHVRPALGYFHCFGCGESGDAISFLQKHDHLTFTEAVERLASRAQVALTYEEGGSQGRSDGPPRARLLAANQEATDFYRAALISEAGSHARQFLEQRGFGTESWERFGVGYAPAGWDALTAHLRSRGFTPQELVLAGLAAEGQRGVYDRFRDRVVWPIRDTSGQTVGFGARKLSEDDQGPKYLNTPETPVYQKSRVLYGLDLAKRAIARGKRVVVVEGYTDVMACHLAGVEHAVATCGTAFGADHIQVLRRMMSDDSAAEVIFTFDPDEAGQKAALRAFSEERRFSAQTYAALAPEGFDPADLRLHRGDEAVRALFDQKVPLFQFALQQTVGRFDLNTIEGRIAALRAAAPIVANIKDPALRPAYTRELARMLGTDLGDVQQAVRSSGQQPARERPVPEQQVPQAPGPPVGPTLASLQWNSTSRLERDALMAMVQRARAVGAELMAQVVTAQVMEPNLRIVRDAMARALPHLDGGDWIQAVMTETPESHQQLVRELAVAPLPQHRPELLDTYARGVAVSLLDRDLQSLKRELLVRLQRNSDPASESSRQIQQQLVALEAARRSLRAD